MKRIILTAVVLMAVIWPGMPMAATQPVRYGDTTPAWSAVSITDAATTTHGLCRAVWVGTTQSIDLFINSSWVTFQGATAGTVIPAQAGGARLTAGAASPNAGDVVFLY